MIVRGRCDGVVIARLEVSTSDEVAPLPIWATGWQSPLIARDDALRRSAHDMKIYAYVTRGGLHRAHGTTYLLFISDVTKPIDGNRAI
jgi:hypothetical protein